MQANLDIYNYILYKWSVNLLSDPVLPKFFHPFNLLLFKFLFIPSFTEYFITLGNTYPLRVIIDLLYPLGNKCYLGWYL